MAFGGRKGGADNVALAYVAESNRLWLRDTDGGHFKEVTGLNVAAGRVVDDIVLDPDDWGTIYLVVTAQNTFAQHQRASNQLLRCTVDMAAAAQCDDLAVDNLKFDLNLATSFGEAPKHWLMPRF